MNINILKEFKLFLKKNLINIIFNHIYINYTYKNNFNMYIFTYFIFFLVF